MTEATLLNDHIERHEAATFSRTIFGFWIYLMTDCILFGTLFVTYAVLHLNTNGGPSAHDIFILPFALVETLILLTSSFTSGLALLATQKREKIKCIVYLGITLLLGMAFLGMEITEFTHLVQEGHDWTRSAFLSSFFTLVGTHGLHIISGIIWIVVLMLQISFSGINSDALRRITCFSLFWHFLDVIWILIFSIVYLIGVQ